MEQSSSWEANRSSASKEIPHILWNPMVQRRIHKSWPFLPILNQINPVHAHASHFLKIHFNIILPSSPRSSKWSFSLRFSYQNTVGTSIHRTCHMPRPAHSSWLDYQNNVWWGVQIIKFLIMLSLPLRCYLTPLEPGTFLNTLFWNTLNLRSFLNVSDQVLHPYKTTGKLELCVP